MLKQFEDKMQKSLDRMANDFMTIRAGRANPNIEQTDSRLLWNTYTDSAGW